MIHDSPWLPLLLMEEVQEELGWSKGSSGFGLKHQDPAVRLSCWVEQLSAFGKTAVGQPRPAWTSEPAGQGDRLTSPLGPRRMLRAQEGFFASCPPPARGEGALLKRWGLPKEHVAPSQPCLRRQHRLHSTFSPRSFSSVPWGLPLSDSRAPSWRSGLPEVRS